MVTLTLSGIPRRVIRLDPNNQAFGFVTTHRNNPRDIHLGLKLIF
jgi:hypothetical protein